MNAVKLNASIYQLLSRREVQVLQLIIQGNTDKDIAKQLNISFHTVRTHHQNILYKTGQHSVSGLIYFVMNNSTEENTEPALIASNA